MGGIAEEFIEGVEKVVSGQVRINPRGEVILTSTHDELRGGDTGLDSVGCVFPADDRWRRSVQDASLRVGHILAAKGLVSRLRWSSSSALIPALDRGGSPAARSTWALAVDASAARRALPDRRPARPETGLFRSPSGEAKFYRATDNLTWKPIGGSSPKTSSTS